MNIVDTIVNLQQLADQSTDAYELMVLSKSIEKLKVGAIQIVSTVNDLPTLPLEENGNLVFVEADDDLYFNVDGNVDSNWVRFRPANELLSWGSNLGDDTTINRSSPVTVAGGITNWSDISAGIYHNLGITNTGVLYAWGNGSPGRLGDGTVIARSSPVTVVGGITNWSRTAAGGSHSLGLTNSGVLYAWGLNSALSGGGQLGDGTVIARSSPVTVVGGITNWSAISAGNFHSLGLTSSGVLYAWGAASTTIGNGQLGDNTQVDKSSPVTVVGGITNWSAVSSFFAHSLGLTSSGVLYAWGTSNRGQLGDGTVIARSSPVTVVGGITNWSDISAGIYHNLGITNTGVLYAWGYNNSGRLGDNTTINRSSPVTVVGGFTNWSQISAGGSHSLGITSSGVLYSWGGNPAGEMGDGTAIPKSSPVTVVGGITNWSAVSAGSNRSFAIKVLQ